MEICLLWTHARQHDGDADRSLDWLGTDDLRQFEALTGAHPLLMGRRTWEILPRRLLAGRQSLVLTRQTTSIPGAVACASLHEALTLASVLRTGKLFLLGGTAVHAQGLRIADRLYVAQVEPIDDDDSLPPIDRGLFELVRQERSSRPGARRLFEEYRRKRLH